MGKLGVFDLERHFAFYGAYHSNPINVRIHMICVWPNFLTSLLLLQYFTPNLTSINGLDLNFAFFFALIHAVFYVIMDRKAGFLAALLCVLGYLGTACAATQLPFSLAWKLVLGVQLLGFTAQFIGHGMFEKRAPALLDNTIQAFLMAPFFVVQEVLQGCFGYEPYPGFQASVKAKIEVGRKEWQANKLKKTT